MIKNRTAQLIYQTVYCTLGFVGIIASLGIFDNVNTIRWDFYVHFTNISNFLCIGVMLLGLIQTVKKKEDGYVEYIVPLGSILARVGQEKLGEVLFFGTDEETVESILIPYFSLDTDYGEIKRDITLRTDSEWLRRAADAAEGIAILRQDPWQTLFSFIKD